MLERLANDLEARQELKGKLIGATLYPAIVGDPIVIVIFLVTYGAAGRIVFGELEAGAALTDPGDDGHQQVPAELGLAAADPVAGGFGRC